VPSATSCLPSLLASHAATQRVPLPESSASLPSAVGLAMEELYAVRTNAGVPCTELTREFGVTALGQWLFNNEKVVAAGVRFDEGNHDASIVPQRSIQ
jgi:hypothetical protein